MRVPERVTGTRGAAPYALLKEASKDGRVQDGVRVHVTHAIAHDRGGKLAR